MEVGFQTAATVRARAPAADREANHEGARVGGGVGGNRRSLSLGEGGRGWKPCRRWGRGGFMGRGAQGVTEFLEAVPIAAGDGMRGKGEQLADGLKGQLMPDLEDDDLALVRGELGEGSGGHVFGNGVGGVGVKPGGCLPFPGQSPPEAAPMVVATVAKAAEGVEAGVSRRGGELEQDTKHIVEGIFGFGVGQTEGPSIKDQLGGALIVQCGRPRDWGRFGGIHDID